jgi:NADH:ubiquinone oxidoreductase subunit
MQQRGANVRLVMFSRHAWLHSANDDPPTQSEYQRSAAYEGHTENLSGTPARYIPYSTVRPKRTTINSTTAQIGSRLKELAQQNQQQRDK